MSSIVLFVEYNVIKMSFVTNITMNHLEIYLNEYGLQSMDDLEDTQKEQRSLRCGGSNPLSSVESSSSIFSYQCSCMICHVFRFETFVRCGTYPHYYPFYHEQESEKRSLKNIENFMMKYF